MKPTNNGTPTGGRTRRRRNRQTAVKSVSGETSIIKYAGLGYSLASDANGNAGGIRPYIGGNAVGTFTATPSGVSVASNYNEYRFMPGSRIRWEPSVSFVTPGRVYCCFCDNPEVNVAIYTALNTYLGAPTSLNYNLYANYVKAMGSLVSFPVYKEAEIEVPQKARRKTFDVNVNINLTDVNVVNRSAQTIFWYCFDGCPVSTGLGSFWYHDTLMVDGLTVNST